MGEVNRAVVPIPTSADPPQPGNTPPKQEAPKAEPRPAWLPEEFKTPEEFADAFKKLKTPPAESAPTAEPKPEVKTVETPAPQPDPVQTLMAECTEAFSKSGQLTDENYKAAEKLGFKREMVDVYVAGLLSLRNQVYEFAGGEENYKSVLSFAQNGGLTPQEAASFDSTLASGNMAAIKLAVTGLVSKFQSEFGSRPRLASGTQPARGSFQPIGKQEMIKAMSSAQYKNDPHFREEIAQRLAVTPDDYQ